jgi:hypothetical protein
LPFDPVPLQDVYGNLLATAVWSAAARTSIRRGTSEAGVSELDREVRGFIAARNRDLIDLASVDKIRSDIGGDRLRAFLLSPEVRDIATGLVIARATSTPTRVVNRLRERFVATMCWFVDLSQETIQADAERLFGIIDQGAKEFSGQLAGSDSHAALSALLQDIFEATPAATAIFGTGTVPDMNAVLDCESKLRLTAATLHGRLEPPNYEGLAPIPIDRLYIEPTFRAVGTEDAVRYSSLFVRKGLHRTVVLGDPGAGKSSFAHSVCHRLAVERQQGSSRGTGTPIFIELREYATVRAAEGLSIGGYIGRVVKSYYQVDPPPGAVEYLLRSGRALVIFDGLDELIDALERRAVRGAIESFAALNPCTRILVTSRVVGYAEAPLNSAQFSLLRIEDFSTDQVAEYVARWFSLDGSLTETTSRDRAEAFLRESESAPDLRSNPLLLALMCSIYKRQSYIPRNRAAVYEQCADMLFDRWDRSRKIPVERPLESHLKPALQHIAKWIYDNQELQGGVRREELVQHTAGYIQNEAIGDPVVARAAAERFVDFCKGRGWVLVAIGTLRDGPEVFGFAHRTFLEFFTAAWLASSSMSNSDLAQELLPEVARGEGHVVALLAIQCVTKRCEVPRATFSTCSLRVR